jgi:oligopeptidase A
MRDMSHNPLLSRTSAIPFDLINAEHVEPAIKELLERTTLELNALKAVSGQRTFENTMRALDNLGLTLDYAMGIVGHLESVATTPELRAAYNAVLPVVSEFRSKLVLDAELWAAIKAFSQTDEARSLTGPKLRFLTKTLEDFKRSGAELSEDRKEQLSRINTELAEITNKFSQNALDATNAFEYTTESESDLSGLPESALEMGKALAAAKGLSGWRFTLQAPSFMAIMTYADSQELRETFYRAYNTRCTGGEFSNVPALYRILELRAEKAAMLGYKDFSDLVLADRMAKTGERALSFVGDLRARIQGHFVKEQHELKEFVRTELKKDPETMQPWDIAYYAEKMRHAHYDFDEEELRPYFPLEQVMKGLFLVVEKTFGIAVEENHELKGWDTEVRAFSASDSTTGKLLGHFYVDVFPRENKRGGAWMNSFITHVQDGTDTLPHVGLIAGNFTPPQGEKPSLLTHDEVTTLFHEFGHLMHHLCSETEIRGQSMEGVAWDFIELPSQILENWCWERSALDLFASHFETGEKLPQALLEKMLKARNFRSAHFLMRQLGFSTVDLALHRTYDRSRDGEILECCRVMLQPFTAAPLPDDYGMIAGFTHIFSSPIGYAAGYYSYQWAEVLDADAFSRFQREGIMNQAVGLAFRNTVLSRGDTLPPEELFRNFMSRDPDTSALLERAGLH